MRLLSMTDQAIAEAIGERIDQLRLKLNVGQAHVAEEAGISRETLRNLVKGKGTLINMISVLRALGELDRLTSLVEDVRSSPIQLAKSAGHQRVRASSPRKAVIAGKRRIGKQLLVLSTKAKKDHNW